MEGAEPSLLPILWWKPFLSKNDSRKKQGPTLTFECLDLFHWATLTVRLNRFSGASLGTCCHVQILAPSKSSSKLPQIERHGQSESVKTRWVAPQCQVQNTRNLPAGSSLLQLSAAWKAAIHPNHIPHPKSTAVLMDLLDQSTTAPLAESEGPLHQLKMSPVGRIHCLMVKEQAFNWCQDLWGFQHG